MLVFLLPGDDLPSAVATLIGRPCDPDELRTRLQALYPDVRVALEACALLLQPEVELRHPQQEPEQQFDLSALYAAAHVIRYPSPPRILA